jgi:hypothetical protein
MLVLTGVGTWVAPYVEAATPITHSYYRTEIVPRIITAQLDANKEHRERLLRETKDRELELQSPGAASLPQYKQRVQESIDRAGAELKKLDESDKSLFDEQKTKH